jgi:hypothetical protein
MIQRTLSNDNHDDDMLEADGITNAWGSRKRGGCVLFAFRLPIRRGG